MKKLLYWMLVVVLLATLLVLGVVLYVLASTRGSIYADSALVPNKQVALVLGASVSSDGTLSPVLKERAEVAAALYLQHKVSKILVSGDNSSVQHNEVYPIGKYLLAQGVPEADIFLDYAGFDTYSSMYRAKRVFGVSSMIVTSQRFHLPRALFLAHAQGVDAVGLDVAKEGDQYEANMLREVPATLKAVLDLLLHREPQYLGPTYLVTGDGTATWVGQKPQ